MAVDVADAVDLPVAVDDRDPAVLQRDRYTRRHSGAHAPPLVRHNVLHEPEFITACRIVEERIRQDEVLQQPHLVERRRRRLAPIPCGVRDGVG
ncbi:MAG: hypothetical protein WAL35_00145, partial [Acidimicrobiales bacterium]